MRWLALVICLVASAVRADQTASWLADLDHPRHESLQLKQENLVGAYQSHDLSNLLTPRTEFLGYIGDNYQRLSVTITSIKRSNAPNSYLVSGTTRVKDNVNTFEGTIAITQIRQYARMHYGVDDEFKDAGFRAQGVAIGSYTFNETQSQPHSGVFQGVVTAYWLVDKEGGLKYDDIEASFSDSYQNNQYVGTWRPHSSKATKVANWGEHRIPFSGDLDIGAAEFGANPKYARQGWKD